MVHLQMKRDFSFDNETKVLSMYRIVRITDSASFSFELTLAQMLLP